MITAHGGSTRRAKKDDFVSTLTRAVSLLPEGKPLWGGPCQKVDIDEVDVRPTGGKGSDQDPEDPDAWEKEIGKAVRGISRMTASWEMKTAKATATAGATVEASVVVLS